MEHSGAEKILIPGACFSHKHGDLVGPLPASRDGSTYLLTMIDCSTRWPEAVPLGCMTKTWCWRLSSPGGWPTWTFQPESKPTGGLSSPLAHVETGDRSRGSSTLPGQWQGGEDPLHPEGGPVHQGWCCCLEGPSALGVAGHACHPQGGDWSVGGGGGLAAAAGGTRLATTAQ